MRLCDSSLPTYVTSHPTGQAHPTVLRLKGPVCKIRHDWKASKRIAKGVRVKCDGATQLPPHYWSPSLCQDIDFNKQTCHLGLNDEASVMLHSVVRPVGRPTNLVMPVDEMLHIRPLNKKQRFSFSRKKYLNSLHYNKNQTTYLNMNIYLHKGVVLFMLSLRFCASDRRFYSDTKDFHYCSIPDSFCFLTFLESQY